ncbi:hypothetical protein HPC49_40410 [Pyxidicoccus fallax]|uniref:Lipoprotein n=1 Tax=Pyxidicoccus fallax TaxID=394095 RepID=A0A848LV39_9BACT|nr:hypothetical protein [Pyxidicoccus fallax]NMO21917.1 hypothetical protein [Pyxidicoccus fallax]NPC84464.1 hypothetical protein [Pyxidicoccus fallax]
MNRHPRKCTVKALMSSLLLAACGGPLESGESPSEPLLDTRESALCAGATVSSLSISSISAYGGEAAGSGAWSVTFPADGIHLDFYVDGIKRGEQDLRATSGRSGTWSFSYRPVSCGVAHSLELKAYPISFLSTGIDRCQTSSPPSASATFSEACPTSTLSCARTSSTEITCTGNGTGGTGSPYTGQWQRTEQNHSTGSYYQSGWYTGPLTNTFYCPQGFILLSPTNSDLLIEFKARDANGLESNALSQSYPCRF